MLVLPGGWEGGSGILSFGGRLSGAISRIAASDPESSHRRRREEEEEEEEEEKEEVPLSLLCGTNFDASPLPSSPSSSPPPLTHTQALCYLVAVPRDHPDVRATGREEA